MNLLSMILAIASLTINHNIELEMGLKLNVKRLQKFVIKNELTYSSRSTANYNNQFVLTSTYPNYIDVIERPSNLLVEFSSNNTKFSRRIF